ncbi:MAG: PKD domain-containing protein [Methanoregula sp.]|jgi:PKD repeat protein|nr:PKD domain-containing protein [Methanoregula sp.]
MQKKVHFFLIIMLSVCAIFPTLGFAAQPEGTESGFIVVASAPTADFFTSTQTGTAPLRISFFDRSEGTLPLRYLWNFGDGTTSVEQNPTHAYAANGRYTVTLTVTNSFGEDTRIQPEFIAVGDPPVPDFSVSPSWGNIPLIVTFTDRTKGSPDTWNWDFGDGSSAAARNPTHTYTKPGIYSVTLSSGNEFGMGQITKSGIINTGVVPDPEFAAELRKGDPPLTVRFHDFSSGSPSTWLWDFGDGSTSTEKDPVHTYTKEGNYTTSLYITNAFGSNSLIRSEHIHVGNPVSPISIEQPVVVPLPANKSQPEGIIGLIRVAKGTSEKNLPTSGFIPPQFMALAAVLTSIFFIFINFLLSNIGALTQAGMKISAFAAELFGEHAIEKVSEKEVEKRGITAQNRERPFFGLSSKEILIVEIAVIIVALAFILADRADLTLEIVLVYMLVGGISVIGHDFAHRYIATKNGHDADTQFWGLGTIIMFVTAWLFGNAFAQSFRNLIQREENVDPHKLGIEMVAGPCVSIIFMILSLVFMPLGGLWAVAGGIGFTINLMTAVYSLMPIGTMDGCAIWKWNRGVYLGLFVPMIIFYFYTYIVV